MKEFDMIKRFFSEQLVKRKDVVIGIGDDCAIVQPDEKHSIAITTDTLVAGTHFTHDAGARGVGHKSIAVSLSDLAAMGAEPSWVSLAITLPNADEQWLEEFCKGVFELCEYYNVQLIGGDTTQGPLSITVTAQGVTLKDKYLTRSGAKPGDWLYVTGNVGDAGLALQHLFGNVELEQRFVDMVHSKLHYPKPRILAGQVLKDYASAAIDVSDGVLADLSHLCDLSGVGANVVLDSLPLSEALTSTLKDKATEFALSAGEDYELLFTVSDDNKVGMETAMTNVGIDIQCIGQINHSGKITTTLNNQPVQLEIKGFEHFSNAQ